MSHNSYQPDDYSRLYNNQSSQNASDYQNQNFSHHLYDAENQANLYQQNQEYQRYYHSPKPVIRPPKEQKPKQPFSPIPLLLVAGVIFLFIGGLIVLTKTWSVLPDAVRALGLLSASVLAFSVSILAERIFRLQKTGFAFYVLGCIFLPLALGGIGVFHLFGQWFSFDGNGAGLLWMVICLSVSISTYLGQKKYQNTVLVWISLISLDGAWISFSIFFSFQIIGKLLPFIKANIILGILLTAYSIAASFLCERYLRSNESSYITPAVPNHLYIINLINAVFMTSIALDSRLCAGILSLIIAVLFCNYRFTEGQTHTGIFGSVFCLMTALYQMKVLFPDSDSSAVFCFMFGMSAVILMSLQKMPKLRTEFTSTYSKAGMFLSIPVILFTGANSLTEHTGLTILLYALLALGAFCFFKSNINPISEDAKSLAFHASLLFLISEYAMKNQGNLILLGLVISALFLLMQALIRKKLWMLAVAILTSIAVMLLSLEHPEVTLLWLCVSGMLGGLIYANRKWRFTLEKCCAWGFLAFLAPALQSALALVMAEDIAWILTFSVSGLLYLAETFIFWKDLRPNATKPYLEAEAFLLSIISFISYLLEETSAGFGFLLGILLLIFAGGYLRKNTNAIAIPQLIMTFVVISHLINRDDPVIIQVTFYVLLLIVYAFMGRILLPEGFYNREDGKMQVDWALLAGILPIFGTSVKIDWYPSILISLFLAIYSLAYIGRVKNRFLPTLMASAFSCLTIFFHNVNDPFEIFTALHESEMKTPQVLLYVLPIHLFILSLLWILPEKHKQAVHNARFVMYCITMFCLLVVSLNFKNASDAILLMLFSFGILFGSFNVKKLRWFTLGFAILFLTTLRLTWKFWTSLHWGIYLFLAGLLLIGIASYTEYKNRYYAEHPDEPKKKMEFFKTWTW
ncbi:MAG: hypothetical protein E7496_09805 [Ruminococcus sp.]|nr:hypothetical protein [Ruminococcus sp.]